MGGDDEKLRGGKVGKIRGVWKEWGMVGGKVR